MTFNEWWKESLDKGAVSSDEKEIAKYAFEAGQSELELKIKHLTQHLEPQTMTALFEQVEEEVRQKQKINVLEKENAELKEELNYAESHCLFHSDCPTQKENESLENIKNIYIGDLLKAKELLEMALDWQGRCGNGHPTWQEVCVKIEQFLNSEVEK